MICGGWVYVTLSDDHDVRMIAYMLLTLSYVDLLLKSGDKSPFTHNTKELAANRSRRNHKFHRVAGAYTSYTFFEWALIVFDVMFDPLAMVEFKALDFAVLSSKPDNLRE
ncbi:Protein cwh43 [Coemansia aciculifera]|nr:Protein cwh43 [Coemansia aciculifera]